MSNILVEKYENKSISTRLKGSTLEYFLKYASRRRAKSMSDAFKMIIDEMQDHLDLSEDVMPTALFTHQNKKAVNDFFLDERTMEKISLNDILTQKETQPEPELIKKEALPEPEPEPELVEKESLTVEPATKAEEVKSEPKDDDDEEVITI